MEVREGRIATARGVRFRPLRYAGLGAVRDESVVGVDVGNEVVERGASVGESTGCCEGLGVAGEGEESTARAGNN